MWRLKWLQALSPLLARLKGWPLNLPIQHDRKDFVLLNDSQTLNTLDPRAVQILAGEPETIHSLKSIW
jgi:hypothetical protein